MQRHIEALNVLTKTACTHWSCEGRYRSALYTVDEIVAVYKCIHLAIIYYDFFTSVYVLQIFFLFFFAFFLSAKNMRQPFSGTAEPIFMKLLPNDTGKMEFETSCRRLVNGEC